MTVHQRCGECGSWDAECASEKAQPDCACARCANARAKGLEAEVEMHKGLRAETLKANENLRAEVERLTKERDEAQADAEADNAEAVRARAERDRAREASAAAFADLSKAARLCAMRDNEYPLKAVQRVAADNERLREALREVVAWEGAARASDAIGQGCWQEVLTKARAALAGSGEQPQTQRKLDALLEEKP